MMILLLKTLANGYAKMTTPSITVRKMQQRDLSFVMNLVNEEGWNQTLNDWNILTGNPFNFCLIAELDNRPVGTASAITYSGKSAWICMVIVKKEFRGRGVCRTLLNKLLADLEKYPAVGLDATPAGKPVYEGLGFMGERSILRLINPDIKINLYKSEGRLSELLTIASVNELFRFDRKISGFGRIHLIRSLIKNSAVNNLLLRQNGNMSGFSLCRQGSRYFHAGPVSALSFDDARLLLSAILIQLNSASVLIDVPADKEQFLDWLLSTGFTLHRSFERMYLKKAGFREKIENQYAIAGPEFG